MINTIIKMIKDGISATLQPKSHLIWKPNGWEIPKMSSKSSNKNSHKSKSKRFPSKRVCNSLRKTKPITKEILYEKSIFNLIGRKFTKNSYKNHENPSKSFIQECFSTLAVTLKEIYSFSWPKCAVYQRCSTLYTKMRRWSIF